ncbi:type III secretion protein K [Pelomonas saccharophila]|uniref:Type III secretion protein K n=1 Tax=Roseateles saccharophilus TaxID=304 RepID=A0ABU1YI70_ROSSA|nr:SctK family type III secretion system sorting platform protein [Roseateles saccharophilus]MDR7267950.1 type III secretion protein K [Roseateles saccharophilus]
MRTLQPAVDPVPPAPEHGPLDMLRLALRNGMHPEDGMHPSWLPPGWPVRHRSIARLGPAGRAVLGQLLRDRGLADESLDLQFDSQLKRVELMDATSLRLLAIYCGFAAHKPLFGLRGGMGSQVRRQALRVADDAVDFVLDRLPQLTHVRVDMQRLQEQPHAAGHVMVQRGYRLLTGTLLPEGPAVLQRVRLKLPQRISRLRVPPLQPRQLEQLRELMLLCIVPERLPQWDWLF